MKKPKIVVLGEKPQGSHWLNLLIRSQRFDIVAGVPRQSDKGVWWQNENFKQILQTHQIPVISRKELDNFQYDILWSLMYGFIIEEQWIAKASYALNLHESPLPRYRGCNGYSIAILEAAKTYGTSFHFLDQHLDHGEIIDQEIFPLNPTETARELYIRTMPISDRVFIRNIENVANNNLSSMENDTRDEPIRPRNSLDELKQIDDIHLDNLEALFRHARAFDFLPFEPAFFILNGSKFYCFINNSFERPYLSLSQNLINEEQWQGLDKDYLIEHGVLRIAIEGRELLIMQEQLYKDYFTLFKR